MKFKELNIHGIIPRQGFLRRMSNGAASLPMVTLKLSDSFKKIFKKVPCLPCGLVQQSNWKSSQVLRVKNNKKNLL